MYSLNQFGNRENRVWLQIRKPDYRYIRVDKTVKNEDENANEREKTSTEPVRSSD